MLLRNLKTGIESVVTKEQYQNMVDTKRSMLFKVINTSESTSPMIPSKITEFQINRPERIAVIVDHNDNIKQGEIVAEVIKKTKPIKK